MVKNIWILLTATATLLVFGSVFLNLKTELQRPELPEFGVAPTFELEDSNSNKYSSAQLTGKVWAVNFFFTNCPSVCPAITGRIASIAKQLRGVPVEFISISVDPERDTSQVLQSYATRYGGENLSWSFLRGPTEEIQRIMLEGFKLGSGELPDIHTTRVVLVDQHGKIRGYYNGLEDGSMSQLAHDIQRLL